MANLKLKENLDIKSTGISASGQNVLPKTGDIIPFAGTVAPTGWVICDGANGTPDLRGFFLVGALSSGNIGATYGNVSHSHTTSVAAYGISNALVSETHGYNSISSGASSAVANPSHSHTASVSRTSGSTSSNLVGNSTTSAGPISFVARPHTHTQSATITAGTGGASNHTHNGTTVNMSTGGTHGFNSTNGTVDQSHSITSNLSGNLLAPTKDYQPFIIMNYIMKV
jgi:microcystin-dependent protein